MEIGPFFLQDRLEAHLVGFLVFVPPANMGSRGAPNCEDSLRTVWEDTYAS